MSGWSERFTAVAATTATWQLATERMQALGAHMHAWSQDFVESAAKCLVPPEGSSSEPHFFVTAWEGPRAGECNEETIALSQLRALVAAGAVPRDVLVWRAPGGTEWLKVGQMAEVVNADEVTPS